MQSTEITKNYYDFLQHDECIFISFNRSYLYLFECSTKEAETLNCNNFRKIKVSLMYDSGINAVLSRENDLKVEMNSNVIYVENVFIELNNIYQRKLKAKPKEHNDIILNATKRHLEDMLLSYKKSSSSIHYSIIIPNEWDWGVRNGLIRPLFVKAGLLSENDHESRLLFFTNLESTFSFIQSPLLNKINHPMVKQMIANGKQYIICGLDFNKENTILVNIELFSAHYPSTTSLDAFYVPKLLKTISFGIPFNFDLKEKIKLYLKTKGFDNYAVLTEKLLKIWGITSSISCGVIEEKFDWHARQDLNDNQIKFIKSMTLEKILPPDIFVSIQKDLLYQINKLNNTSSKNNIVFMGTYNAYPTEEYYKGIDASRFLINRVNQFMGIYWERTYKVDSKLQLAETYMGSLFLTKQQILISTHRRPLVTIPRNKIIDKSRLSHVRMFNNNLKTFHVINIVMSYTGVDFSCSYTGISQSIEHKLDFNKCAIKPLKSFIIQPNIYQRPLLQITKSMMVFMETMYKSEKILNLLHEIRRVKNKIKVIKYLKKKNKIEEGFNLFHEMRRDKNKIKFFKYLKKKNKIEGCFKIFRKIRSTLTKTKLELLFSKPDDEKQLLQIHEYKYIDLFLMIYLIYIDELVKDKLYGIVGTACDDNKVGYIISVEKLLMDNVFVSKDHLQKLLFNIGMFRESNENRKVRIVTHGEGLLSKIQQQTKSNLQIKSYFIVTQLNEAYIQLALHQVVKTSSPEEDDANSIIIQDKTIEIENVNESVCKQFWSHIKSNNAIDYCELHEKIKEDRYYLYSLQNISKILIKIKKWMSKSFSSNNNFLNMDGIEIISINDTCECSINVTLRNIIDNGLNPILKNITTIIAGSVVNKNLFGYYTVDHLFVLGNIFNLKQESLIFTKYINILQHKLVDSFELKEKFCKIFILKETLYQILQPIIKKKQYIYDSFIDGIPYQVFTHTYILYNFQGSMDILDPIVIVQRGDLIQEISKQVSVEKSTFRLAKLKYSINDDKDNIPLEKYRYDDIDQIILSEDYHKHKPAPYTIKLKYLSYKNTLQIFLSFKSNMTISPLRRIYNSRYKEYLKTSAQLQEQTIAYF